MTEEQLYDKFVTVTDAFTDDDAFTDEHDVVDWQWDKVLRF